jgi:hypothetical protein
MNCLFRVGLQSHFNFINMGLCHGSNLINIWLAELFSFL